MKGKGLTDKAKMPGMYRALDFFYTIEQLFNA